ncbi:uncharacterized protein [Ptychodera flava]|uniref:uncharacterized protein n=1 Tax=Ptychodera flava TaxID=63121 RepID=UPI00396AAD9B
MKGVKAIDIDQIYVPPGFDVCVEEGSTLLIDTGIGSEVEDQICFTEILKNENIEVDGKVVKTPTFSFDTTKVMCSANKKKIKVLWFENGVPIPEGKSGYVIKRTDNSSILTIEYIDLKPNCTMEYMCWVSTDCSEGKNRTVSVNISDITVCPPCNRSIECPTEACSYTRETIDYSASNDHTEIYSANSTLCINAGLNPEFFQTADPS